MGQLENRCLIGRWMRRIALLLCWCAWLLSLFLCFVRGRLTSIGFEREDRYGTVIVNRWYGVVYPGQGSVIAGGEATFEPDHGQPIDRFDLGGAWLQRFNNTTDEAARWQRLGFVWRMTEHQRWVGVPTWLVAAILGIIPIRGLIRDFQQRRATPNGESGQEPRQIPSP
jgi:hypothetical protein